MYIKCICFCQVRAVRTEEARGLLWLMEEEALQPGGSVETLLGRLFSYYGPAEGESKGEGWNNTLALINNSASLYLKQLKLFSNYYLKASDQTKSVSESCS